jgi:hypothetical protein
MKSSSRAPIGALLVDGTALFLGARNLADGGSVDYLRLDQLLKSLVPGLQNWQPAIFFTSWDRGNDGQNKFLEFLESRIGWTVDRIVTHDTLVRPPARAAEEADEGQLFIKLDAQIAFSLGRLVEKCSHIVVLGDSFNLAAPMEETAKRGTHVSLAYFDRLLDPRWRRILRLPKSPIDFFDLSHASLFNGGAARPRTKSGLSSLP